jgi:dynein heavy chain
MERDSTNYCQITEDAFLLEEILLDYIQDYNIAGANAKGFEELQLVFFNDAILHLSRICRILRQHRGHALLCGMQGMGRRSLIKLAAHIYNFSFISLERYRSLDKQKVYEEYKQILINSAIKGIPTVLLITEDELLNDSLVEDINNLVTMGDIPGLFDKQDIERIITQITQRISIKRNSNVTRDSLWQIFLSNIQSKIHVVICATLQNFSILKTWRQYPTLITSCTIDSYYSWPQSAMYAVAAKVLQNHSLEVGTVEVSQLGSEKLKHAVAGMFVVVPTLMDDLVKKYFEVNSYIISLLR